MHETKFFLSIRDAYLLQACGNLLQKIRNLEDRYKNNLSCL
jgi:hypothetical protein